MQLYQKFNQGSKKLIAEIMKRSEFIFTKSRLFFDRYNISNLNNYVISGTILQSIL